MAVSLLLAAMAALRLDAAACIEDAETPTATAWSMTGLWHIADGTANTRVGSRSGTRAFYFGRDAFSDYNDRYVKDASLTSPLHAITSPSDANLSFWAKWQVESFFPACYDQIWLEVENPPGAWNWKADISPASDPPGGAPGVGIASGSGLGGAPLWQFHSVDLSSYIGSSARFRFRFLSGAHTLENACQNFAADAAEDAFLGIVIDDIALGCAPAPLTLQKSATVSFAAPGDTVTFAIYAKNWDASPRSLEVWDSLPAYAQFVSASAGSSVSGGMVVFNVPGLAAGAVQALTLALRVDPLAPLPLDWLNQAAGSSSAGGPDFTSPEAMVKLRAPGLSLKKSASLAHAISGDRVTFTIELSNFSSTVQPLVELRETYPSGFQEQGVFPDYSGFRTWNVSALGPGQSRSFAVWGILHGLNGQVAVNRAEAWISGGLQAAATASVSLSRPELPQLSIRAVYPNPAPSFKSGLPQGAFIYFETNQGMNLELTLITLSGEVLRRIPLRAERGKNQAAWDLKNEFGLEAASGVYVARLWGDTEAGVIEAWTHVAVSR